MNCAECEQLIDAHLDGELSGSLRLEFDAHRLRCRRCQLTLAMMESVGHVVAHERPAPVLPDDFTDRVMSVIDRKRPLSVRLRTTRVAVIAGALLQAAAVLYLAVVLPWRPSASPPGESAGEPSVELAMALDPSRDALDSIDYEEEDRKVDLREAYYDYVVARLDAAWTNSASELGQLAKYPTALSVSDDFARASARMGEANPWHVFLEALVPLAPEEAEPSTPSSTNQYSL